MVETPHFVSLKRERTECVHNDAPNSQSPKPKMEATPADELQTGKEEWEAKGKDTNAFFI